MSTPQDDRDWEPGTSLPGEIYTVEGRIKATGAFARNLKNSDPRYTAYKRGMWKITAGLLGLVVVIFVVAFLAST